ncbi:hypothetical protein M9458_050218, partial [Cirrhinus mrigala]
AYGIKNVNEMTRNCQKICYAYGVHGRKNRVIWKRCHCQDAIPVHTWIFQLAKGYGSVAYLQTNINVESVENRRDNQNIQYNNPTTADQQTKPSGPKHLPLQLDLGLFNWKTSVSLRRPQHLEHYHTEHSPLLFTLLTHDCTAKFSSNHIIKFADDTTVVGLISSNDETHYREEVAQLVEWCGANNLSLNVSKTKEVVMDFRRNSADHPPLTIDSSAVERVSSTKFLGVHITEDLTWTTNTMSLSKKAQQRLHFLRRLKRASLPPPILTTFYRGTIESVLTSCITVWYGNCSAADHKTLQWTVNTAAKIIGAPLPSLLDIFLARCSGKTTSIVKDPTHPSHHLFQLLPSGRRYRSISARSARLLNSFFPQAVRALNSNHLTPL